MRVLVKPDFYLEISKQVLEEPPLVIRTEMCFFWASQKLLALFCFCHKSNFSLF